MHFRRHTSLLLCVLSNSLFAVPAVTSISPVSGPIAGGTTVTITGSGFTGATAVNFGAVTVSPTVINDNTIQATSPGYYPKAVDVTVTADNNTSPTLQADLFTFQGDWIDYISSAALNPNLSYLDLRTNTVTGTTPVLASAAAVAVTPDGLYSFVPNGGLVLQVINNATQTVVGSIPVPSGGAFTNVMVSSDGTKLYAADPNAYRTYTYSIPAFHIESPTFAGALFYPTAMASSLDGQSLYIVDQNHSDLGVFDAVSGSLNTMVGGLSVPVDLAVTPDGSEIYIVSNTANAVRIVDTSTLTLNPNVIPVGTDPVSIAITSDGTTAYVLNSGSKNITKIDLATNTTTTIAGPGFGTVTKIVLSPDNSEAYILDTGAESGVVHVLNLSSLVFSEVLITAPQGEAISPDQSPVARFSFTNNAGTVNFDASLSASPTGSIATYAWDFGDGVTQSTSSPTISHAYASLGTYAATLTVTNTAGTSTQQISIGKYVTNNGSSFAAFTQNVVISNVTPPAPAPQAAPVKFKGKLKKAKLKMSWTKVPHVAFYQIYEHHKKIKTARAYKNRTFSQKIFLNKYYQKHMGKLKKKLVRSYKIRAVGNNGVKSEFKRLKF